MYIAHGNILNFNSLNLKFICIASIILLELYHMYLYRYVCIYLFIVSTSGLKQNIDINVQTYTTRRYLHKYIHIYTYICITTIHMI